MNIRRIFLVAILCLIATGSDLRAGAQSNDPGGSGPPRGADPASTGSTPLTDPAGTQPAQPSATGSPGMSFLKLLFLGGWFMIPLAGISFAVVALAVERGLALRRERHLPDRLVERLGRLSEQAGGLDPRDAYRICQAFPSSTSTLFRKVLVKVGRPQAELEAALHDAAQRNAIRLQQPVSWLTWCAAVAPLLGLLGTVWGITQAFYDTTQLEVGQNQAEALASGIYMALVTTIFGLVIAIPATTFGHYFENRIVSLSNQIEEMIASLLPQLERYEGQVRFTLDDSPEAANGSGSAGRAARTRAAEAGPVPDKRTRAGI